MDYRLALFTLTFEGLRLSPDELARLLVLADPGDPACVRAAVEDRVDADRLRRAADRVSALERRGVRWSYLGQPDYPEAWYRLSCRPVVFTYRGQPVWTDWPTIAVVGSRTPSLDTTRWLQRELPLVLTQERLAVVSGGARGVDQQAHRLALGCRRPTVCVVPSGLLNPYPPGHEWLWEEIVDGGGAFVSTFPPDEGLRRHHFPIRNRWIAGLAPVTFVAEANERSGSYLTACLARDENRVVATLPVSANATQGLANLKLIYDGQVMIRDGADLRVLLARVSSAASGPGSA